MVESGDGGSGIDKETAEWSGRFLLLKREIDSAFDTMWQEVQQLNEWYITSYIPSVRLPLSGLVDTGMLKKRDRYLALISNEKTRPSVFERALNNLMQPDNDRIVSVCSRNGSTGGFELPSARRLAGASREAGAFRTLQRR